MKIFVVCVVLSFWIAISTYPNNKDGSESSVPILELDGRYFVPMDLSKELYQSLSESEEEVKELRRKYKEALRGRARDQDSLREMSNRMELLLEEKKMLLKVKKASPRWIEGFVGGGMLLRYSPVGVHPYGEIGARIRLKFLYEGLAIRFSGGYPDSRIGLEVSF